LLCDDADGVGVESIKCGVSGSAETAFHVETIYGYDDALAA
jgi:hypothetical protein